MSYPGSSAGAGGASVGSGPVQSLDQLLAPLRYPDKPRVVRDVTSLLRQTNSLQCKVGELVQNDGQTSTLLNLTGTVPIFFRGASYNIPVTIWLLEQYPNRPPQVYVTPTKEMRIKDRHKHVDSIGMVYLPYLNSWTAPSSLVELVTFMSSVFSEDPPVFKAPAGGSAGGGGGGGGATSASVSISVSPSVDHLNPIHHHQPSSSFANPAYQSQIQSPPPQPLMSNYAAAYSQPPLASPPLSSPSPSPSLYSPVVSLVGAGSSSSLSFSSSSPASSSAARKDDLVRSVTSKLRTKLTDQNRVTVAEMDRLFNQQAVLNSNASRLQNAIDQMKSEHARLRSANATATAKIGELKLWLDANENDVDVDVDRGVYARDTWSKQLLEAVCEDMSIEDTLYVLDRALQDDRIDFQSWIKHVRVLARKQFMARALAGKIQQKQVEQAHQARERAAPIGMGINGGNWR